MSSSPSSAAQGPPRQGRRSAYQAANWHLVRAGLALAVSGVPQDAPEIRAIASALRAVNEAGGLSGGEPRFAPAKSPYVRKEERGGVHRAEGSAGGPPGKVA
ncbi:MAG TPA: hypothetical protein VNO22_18700 [Planctomycetota bacterium]|nr:hypothetical protein [Planctomycetota bacterium]